MAKVIFGMTGSSAVALLPLYVMEFRRAFGQEGELRYIQSRTAAEMFPKDALKVFSGPLEGSPAEHISLAEWADVLVVLPCTADFIVKASLGICDSDLLLIAASQPKDIVLFPNMNSRMWESPNIEEAVAKLRSRGVVVVEPAEAPAFEAASGETVVGRVMPDPPDCAAIVASVVQNA